MNGSGSEKNRETYAASAADGGEGREKRGYLEGDFRLFHLSDSRALDIGYHYHDFDKIIIMIRGDVEYIIEGRAYRLEPYDILLVNHHDIHQPVITGSAPYERIVVYLSPSFISSCSGDGCDLNDCFRRAKELKSNVMRVKDLKISRLYRTIRDLDDACREENGCAPENGTGEAGTAGSAAGPFGGCLYRKLLFLEFMVHLNRAALGNRVEYVKTLPTNRKVLEIMEYIHANLTADLSIDSLAGHFYLSRYHMMRLFKQETGRSIGQYIGEKRLLLAREQMGGERSLTELAFGCGFKNYPAFLRAYKKAFGETPAARNPGIS